MAPDHKSRRVGEKAHAKLAATLLGVPHTFEPKLIQLLIVFTKGVEVKGVWIGRCIQFVKLWKEVVPFQESGEEGHILVLDGW